MTKNISRVFHQIGDELVVSISDVSMIHSKVYASGGIRVGKVTRILGPVNSPYGIVKISGKQGTELGDIEEVEIRGAKND